MIGYKTLAIPGPTNMPHEVQRSMQIPLEDHRAPDIPEFTKPLFSDLKDIFRTNTGEVFVFPGSGTGGWEAAISNLLTAGDGVLTSSFGQFSSLWVDMCRDYGMDVQAAIDMPRVFARGNVVDVERSVPAHVLQGLSAKGHALKLSGGALGGGQAIFIDHDRGVLTGGSDPRKDGLAIGY